MIIQNIPASLAGGDGECTYHAIVRTYKVNVQELGCTGKQQEAAT
jgi:hypothetical protein